MTLSERITAAMARSRDVGGTSLQLNQAYTALALAHYAEQRQRNNYNDMQTARLWQETALKLFEDHVRVSGSTAA